VTEEERRYQQEGYILFYAELQILRTGTFLVFFTELSTYKGVALKGSQSLEL
jgi:hypothetical protein